MSSHSISQIKNIPNHNELNNIHKLFEVLQTTLTMPLTKKSRPNMAPDTVDKAALTLLTQMVMKDSIENASELLKIIGKLIFQFVKDLKSLGPSLESFLNSFIAEYMHDKGENLFCVSPSTVNRALQGIPIKDANTLLSDQLDTITTRFKKEGLKSKENLLVIDPSDVKYYGKYYNQYTEFGYTGQKNTYQRGFREIPILLNPDALIGSSSISKVCPKEHQNRDIPLWIQAILDTVTKTYERGSLVKLIVGDREFYAAIGFGYSYFGLWNSTIKLQDNPRMLVPKKIWGDSTDEKWSYLLNSNVKLVQLESISIDYYQQTFLGPNITRLPSNQKGTKFEIPVACVAAFDSYPNKHKTMSLSWGRINALKIQKHITEYGSAQTDAENDLIDYIDRRNKTQLKIPRKSGRKGKSANKSKPLHEYLPKYAGKRRRKFKDSTEKELYGRCCQFYDRRHYWIKEKNKLANRLMFYYISLFEGEDITTSESELIELVEQYHERWSIENCIKFIKHIFYLKTNSRKVCARHIRWTLSCLAYNCWHYWRIVRESRVRKRNEPGWKPYDISESPPVRKKIERECSSLLSAQGYLLESLSNGLQIRMRKLYKEKM